MNLGDLEFKPEDFKNLEISSYGAENCARIANRLLAERLEKAELVYGVEDQGTMVWSKVHIPPDTHTARLVCIEEVGE